MKVRISITGTAPLIVHNIRLANPLDPIAKAMKQISSKRKKTDEDFEALAWLEFEGSFYMAPDVGPVIPGANVEKCIVEGARITKAGKQVERGLFVIDNEAPLLYDGPRDVDGLWAREEFRSVMAVKVGQSRIMRTRPIFKTWALDADAEVDLGLLSLPDLRSILTDAGNMVGLGDYRPRYGRFTALVEEL
jgi:hypothetical protein